ncbi:membrane fusion protein, multidrug efflux system [Cyclonatronum proteinivorum]|uniref:Membrane fusion protein, multidrug efflux system n=1 Tax=Cyclonatronum proteinivorum TaxID=1457365 RepID=A0A345UN84_9BACT|nr:efflux RND transporter periplasmic adaptor subunit [Cyclonatronum proteinivorum]AXJ01936.1 membrane fusion protein, multidrug efflux system [Cyclonatronum proteinivorum]
MNKLTVGVLTALAGAVLLFSLLLPRLSGGDDGGAGTVSAQPQTAPQQNDRRLAVRAVVMEPQTFENRISSTGTVVADESVTLQAEVSGRVTSINFTEGELVNAGNLLVKINDADLQAELRRAQYRRNLAEIREQRMASLLERNATSQQEYDTALNELMVIQAEIDLINARIAQTEIRAPFDGIIGLRAISPGSYITPQTYITELQKVNRVKVDFSVPERFSGMVVQGQAFRFNRQGSENTYDGEVYAIQPRVEPDTRTLRLRGVAENTDNVLLPGAFVEVDLALRAIDRALMAPSEAIIPEMGGQSVYVYRNGKAERRQVEIGVRTDRRVHITEGLAQGDTLLTTGMLQLRPGMDVRIAEIRSSAQQ